MQFNITRILFFNNELKEALGYTMKAIALDPLWSHSHPLAARILERLGRPERARALNKKAAKIARFS